MLLCRHNTWRFAKEATMKAILKNGAILPKEPLPKDWDDGTELQVEKAPSEEARSSDDLDRWMAAVQASAADMDAEDEIILENAIREIRGQARDFARKEAERS
jgi:hypothetical protein